MGGTLLLEKISDEVAMERCSDVIIDIVVVQPPTLPT